MYGVSHETTKTRSDAVCTREEWIPPSGPQLWKMSGYVGRLRKLYLIGTFEITITR